MENKISTEVNHNLAKAIFTPPIRLSITGNPPEEEELAALLSDISDLYKMLGCSGVSFKVEQSTPYMSLEDEKRLLIGTAKKPNKPGGLDHRHKEESQSKLSKVKGVK